MIISGGKRSVGLNLHCTMFDEKRWSSLCASMAAKMMHYSLPTGTGVQRLDSIVLFPKGEQKAGLFTLHLVRRTIEKKNLMKI